VRYLGARRRAFTTHPLRYGGSVDTCVYESNQWTYYEVGHGVEIVATLFDNSSTRVEARPKEFASRNFEQNELR